MTLQCNPVNTVTDGSAKFEFMNMVVVLMSKCQILELREVLIGRDFSKGQLPVIYCQLFLLVLPSTLT